jgi:uncharacterized protein (DUF1697 family)
MSNFLALAASLGQAAPMRFAAFLRGINVGGRVIKMVDLRACLEGAGYQEVTTLLQSGNVVFEAHGTPAWHGAQLEKLLGKRFGYDAQVLVYRLSHVAKMVEANPFSDAPADAHQDLIFSDPAAARELAALAEGLDDRVERVKLGKGCVYWTVPKGETLLSEFAKRMSKAKLLQRTTTRNLNTVQKLLGLQGKER